MVLPSSGPLDFTDLQGEFGGTNPISLAEFYGLGTLPTSGAISLSDFYGQSAQETRTISATTANLDMATYLSGEGLTSGTVEVTITGTIYSTSTANAALTIANIPAPITLIVVLASTAKLYGKGGAGASSTSSGVSGWNLSDVYSNSNEANNPNSTLRYRYKTIAGGAGGTALKVSSACSIVHQGGLIYGGGGGGGTSYYQMGDTSGSYSYAGGPGAGGGQGYSGGAGGGRVTLTISGGESPAVNEQTAVGTAGTSSAPGTGGTGGYTSVGKVAVLSGIVNAEKESTANRSYGGDGGAYGVAGESPSMYATWAPGWHNHIDRGGAGGAAGKGIDGNSNITWTTYDSSKVKGPVV